MAGHIEQRLRSLGIELPTPAKAAANYVPFILAGRQLYISGQLPMASQGLAYAGKLGANVDLATGQKAARLCALNILAQAKAALGDLDRIERCLRLGGFVNAAPDFDAHPQVINGASDLLCEVLGDKGQHTRFAVGCASLPFGAAVEVDALFAVT